MLAFGFTRMFRISAVAVIISTTTTAVYAQVTEERGNTSEAQQVITRKSTLEENRGPAELFVGDAVFSRFPVMPSNNMVAPAIVRFEAGAYTNWHIHPRGQYLIATDGEGRTQEWGQPIQVIRPGDTVWCPPGVKHWHGGGEHSSMTHIAISPVAKDGQSVTWLERVDLPNRDSTPEEKQTMSAAVTLSERQLAIVPIAAFNAVGDLENLKPALQQGLERGLTVNDIKEVLSHQYAYVGFPRSLNGLAALKTLLEERKKAGLNDQEGEAASTLSGDTDYYQLGTKTLMHLTKGPASRPLFEFAPVMDHSLKAHLFGYLFSRDNISYIDREVTTIATLAAVGNVNSQLRSHFNVATNLGLSSQQLDRIVETLESEVGADVAKNAAQQLDSVNR